jgi:hypothetical protein
MNPRPPQWTTYHTAIDPMNCLIEHEIQAASNAILLNMDSQMEEFCAWFAILSHPAQLSALHDDDDDNDVPVQMLCRTESDYDSVQMPRKNVAATRSHLEQPSALHDDDDNEGPI